MEHYVTLFDANFMPQGLALHKSLQRHAGEFMLWVLCMDEACEKKLIELNEATIRVVPLGEVESRALLDVKPGRSRAEYCWTMTPFTPDIVFARDPHASRATYVDADVYLLSSPMPLFQDMERSGKPVQITEHAFDPAYDQTESSGRFCVQFITFNREGAREVLDWWQRRCVEWCFARHEDGKFGDQKYLDSWPEKFGAEVHVMSRNGLLMAPWNARVFPASEAVAWHFHGLRILGRDGVLLHTSYDVPDSVDKMVYAPYVRELQWQMKRTKIYPVQTKLRSAPQRLARALIKRILGRTRKVFSDPIVPYRS